MSSLSHLFFSVNKKYRVTARVQSTFSEIMTDKEGKCVGG